MSVSATVLRPVRDLIPATGAERRYILVNLVSCVGDGLFLGGIVVFATKVVGLNPQQVATALSATGVAGFVAAGTMGTLADRFGARRMLLILCLLQAAGCLLYCAVRSFPAFTTLACLVAVAEFGQGPARAAIVSAIVEGEDRIRLRAQSRALTNIGFALGAGLSALALTVGTLPAYYLLPIGTAVSYLVVALLARGLPEIRSAAGAVGRRSFTAVRNLPFLATTALQCVLSMHLSLLLVVVPLWIVERTTAPPALISVLLVANTILVVLFQVRASSGADTIAGAVRKCRWAAAALLACCVVVGLSGGVPSVPAVTLLLAGCALLTAGELMQVAGAWTMAYEMAPKHAQAEYLGGLDMSTAGQAIVGPAVCTWVVLSYGTAGWIALGLVFVLAAAALGPTARRTSLSLARLHPEPAPAPASATG